MALYYDFNKLELQINKLQIIAQGFSCHIAGCMSGTSFDIRCTDPWPEENGQAVLVLPSIKLKIFRRLDNWGNGCQETIQLYNYGTCELHFSTLDFGYLFPLSCQKLHALPFTVQQDGKRHIYSAEILREGVWQAFVNNKIPAPEERVYGNSVYSDPSRTEPALLEDGRLRSEAWFWGCEHGGILAAKYNNKNIEYSIAEPDGEDHQFLRLGGAGFCLYGEPSQARVLSPGAYFCFGSTFYLPCSGFTDACCHYRQLLDVHGHALPEDYSPLVHWNELYDIGWFHSDRQKLNENYTRKALLEEAEKAKECGCGALYLDPGWEFAEGTSFFDYHRLGEEKELVQLLREEYNLELSIRCILRTYIPYWPDELNAIHQKNGIAAACMLPYTIIPSNQLLYEQCLCNSVFFEEKLRRIEKLIEDGASFLMLDEMDWRGPCFNTHHSHAIPSTASEHADAVYELARRIKNKYGIPVEVHDPIWPWNSSIYTPTYWRQGFGTDGSYTENWGFEFMWDCIQDLQSGRALCLYYYNLCCNIPLYLHINMSADNDQCLFFWWAASTVRHLGIGGKNCHPSVVPPDKHFHFDPEERFEAYKLCMKQYLEFKAYYQRGIFYGIHEYAHLHVLKTQKGGILDLFNCTDSAQICTAEIPAELLGASHLKTRGADALWENEHLIIRAALPPLSHVLVQIGDAAKLERYI